MYLEHFELKEAPFSITPDPRFVYLTAQHRDAMAHLLFGINQGGGGGFVQLTGEVGTGKTTLCRLLMAQVPNNVRIALVLNPMQAPIELLRTICAELRILLPRRINSIKVLTDALTNYLLASYAAGLRVVVVLDEAQNLSFEALEQVRLLTNLETPTQKLLQIILLGQPELREVLARPQLRQLAQRITARFHLAPLTAEETAAYVEHRLAVAGRRRPLFRDDALRELFRRTQGYPRALNVVADRALLGAYARGQELVDAAMVRAAAVEVRGETGNTGAAARKAVGYAAPALGLALAVWGGALLLPAPDRPAMPAVAAPAQIPLAQDALKRLDDLQPFVTESAAVDVVAGWWDSAAPGRVDRCSIAREGALCAHLRLNERLLRALNRPLAIALLDGRGRSWFALRRIENGSADLAGSQRLQRLHWAALAERWVGDAVLVVARPTGYDGGVIAPGADVSGLGVVHAGLAAFDGQSVESARYDERAAVRVRALQERYGLHADGLIGAETMALLMALQPGGPFLSKDGGDGASVSAAQP
ncbi:MAG: AAA family ATPase [Xanthomonadales bacterium]|nr:AAA family ATPase [Xanthomonadales bacterium]MBK7143658.1 AAA family ATPase [Xanthomonadales bacterium]MCC6561134.1 AAA family ATPase [Xanthomonadales bacterium]